MIDDSIVKQCIKGKRQAQRQIFDEMSPLMMAICMRYCKTRTEAEDVLQDAFVKVFKSVKRFQFKGSFEGWVKRIVVNTALDNIRKKRLDWSDIDDEGIEQTVANRDDPSRGMRVDFLMGLINTLPSGYQAVFNMYAIEGYSHKEIAKELNVTESTSKTQYKKAREKLQELITYHESYRLEVEE